MEAIIAVSISNINNEAKQTINARELHNFLEVGKDFSNWVKDRIEQFGFVENQDFVITEVLCSPNSVSTKARPQMRKEYALTINMAKELSMVERNDKGKQARQYFIECERIAKQTNIQDVLHSHLSSPDFLRSTLLVYTEKVIALQNTVSALQPMADVAERIANSDGLLGFREVAKILHVNERKFKQWLISNDWIHTTSSRMKGKAAKCQAGYVEHKTQTIEYNGEDKTVCTMYFTPKGVAKLTHIFNVDTEADFSYAA